MRASASTSQSVCQLLFFLTATAGRHCQLYWGLETNTWPDLLGDRADISGTQGSLWEEEVTHPSSQDTSKRGVSRTPAPAGSAEFEGRLHRPPGRGVTSVTYRSWKYINPWETTSCGFSNEFCTICHLPSWSQDSPPAVLFSHNESDISETVIAPEICQNIIVVITASQYSSCVVSWDI